MLPNDIETAARQLYNAIGDSFYTSAEILNYIYHAELQLAREAEVIEKIYQTTTVASQQDYTYPTTSIAIKRITIDGKKLKPITMREDDALTLSNAATIATGTSLYYFQFESTISLRPIPSAGGSTLKIYSLDMPSVLTSGSQALDVPTMWHMAIVDFVLSKMCLKDKQVEMAGFYEKLWDGHIVAAKRFTQKRKRRDGYAVVQDEDILPVTILGAS